MNILITGAGSGIGKSVATYYAERAHNVYAIDIMPAQIERVRFFEGDITNEDSLIAIRKTLQDEAIRLDLVLHFAGIFLMDNFLEVNDKTLRRIFDVNVLGCIRVNQIFFGLLNKNAKILITTSEVAPLDALPFNGIYSVTKTALDAYAQSLRHEAGLLGVQVVTVRPGAVDTALARKSIPSMRKMVENSKYFSGQAEQFERLMRTFTGKPIAPSVLAARIYAITQKKNPKFIYTVHSNPWLKLLSILPKRTQVFLVKKMICK